MDVKSEDVYRAYAEVFERCGYVIGDLPVLNLGGRMGWTDYIDFIEMSEMTSSVMKFRDGYGRPGIAMKWKGISGELEGKHAVIALFRRYTDENSRWSFGWGGSDCSFENLYREMNPNDQLVVRASYINPVVLEEILKGQNKYIALCD